MKALMKNLLRGAAIATSLVTTSAAFGAVILPNRAAFGDAWPVVSETGTDGATVSGTWRPNGQLHVFLYTGAQPEFYGALTVAVPQVIVSAGERPVCVLTAAWTQPDYALGYDIPEWPAVFLQHHAYKIAVTPVEVTFRWNVLGSALAPYSSYSLDVVCPPKGPGLPMPAQ